MPKKSAAGSTAKPTSPPTSHFGEGADVIQIVNGFVWAPLRGKWLQAKPEEVVRQRFIHRLHSRYGYSLKQMAQEKRTMHGHGSPKADIVVAKDEDALTANRDYVLVVETKAEHVTIVPADYSQGESYARAVGCEFMVAHNEKETRAFRLVPGAPGTRVDIEDAPHAEDLSDAKRLEAIRAATKAFSRDEFRKLLHECHAILRDNHKLDPGAAFDEISKVLFIKMYFERGAEGDRFTRDYMDRYAKVRRSRADEVMTDLFDDTKKGLKSDRLFEKGDRLNISYATFRRLVEKLERFNLSATSDDIKGIAFEQFLGQTFRGELGQFFTPRPIVDFMVGLVDPREDELVCDPASGTGGFLIRTFEYVRDQIERSVQDEKDAAIAKLQAQAAHESWDDARLADAIDENKHALNASLDMEDSTSRLGRLSRECIFGSDAEARAARTSKMNMIMHGDGHGGIYFHDGLLDTGGLLENRFDVVLTNPPFGATVTADQLTGDTTQTRMVESEDDAAINAARYGEHWAASRAQLAIAEREKWPILQLFDIGRNPVGGETATSQVRNSRPTESLFVERAIRLLKPGGRVAIVLPDGLLNNPSLEWFRDYIEGTARLRAVISLPQEVFASAKATVKTSIVLLERFTAEDRVAWKQALITASEELEQTVFEPLRTKATEQLCETLESHGINAGDALNAQQALADAYLDRSDTARLNAARRTWNSLLNKDERAAVKAATKTRDTIIRELEKEKAERITAAAKQLDDYPIFMAEVEHAGITSTGVTGDSVPNELPSVLEAFREWSRNSLSLTASSGAVV
ncbi:N-6 DNA methylase [Arthrobacter sp. ISL-28]|uniref:N-6 DNA methylase n=1 Tax=Arthrobacter sp. ISL-28 TaxID=2819108 RepID=UPI001BE93D16|nr:N-6 DNA methylase [Arthrobacter sp. ISL-28]MBT2522763.1 N-6 DNA methylase [Arthrobacter sp. ISL-28]